MSPLANARYPLCKPMSDGRGPNFFAPRKSLQSYFGNLFALKELTNKNQQFARCFTVNRISGLTKSAAGRKKGPQTCSLPFANQCLMKLARAFLGPGNIDRLLDNLFALENLGDGKSTVCKARYGKPNFAVGRVANRKTRRSPILSPLKIY